MKSNLAKYKSDLSKLLHIGDQMFSDITFQIKKESKQPLKKHEKDEKTKVQGSFGRDYQRWFTESCAVIRQVIPDRLQEFITLYKGDGKRKDVDVLTYTIQDFLMGARSAEDSSGKKRFNDIGAAGMRLNTQIEILRSVEARFDSSLFEIRQLVQADLFDHELDAARALLRAGFLRGAGAVAGVVLESHLQEVCLNHQIAVTKKDPGISDFNDLLKSNQVLDIPTWRFIQRLGDLRNLCDHNKDREPKSEEVAELIDGVEKIMKTIF